MEELKYHYKYPHPCVTTDCVIFGFDGTKLNVLLIERGIEEIFDVMDERGNEDERYEKLDRIWSKLKEVDRMILESYYVDGCRMEEIAKRIGYKNGNSVKSKKKKVLMKIMEMRDRAGFKDLPAAA